MIRCRVIAAIDIISVFKIKGNNIVRARRGDELEVISEHGDTLICRDKNGNTLSVNKDKTIITHGKEEKGNGNDS